MNRVVEINEEIFTVINSGSFYYKELWQFLGLNPNKHDELRQELKIIDAFNPKWWAKYNVLHNKMTLNVTKDEQLKILRSKVSENTPVYLNDAKFIITSIIDTKVHVWKPNELTCFLYGTLSYANTKQPTTYKTCYFRSDFIKSFDNSTRIKFDNRIHVNLDGLKSMIHVKNIKMNKCDHYSCPDFEKTKIVPLCPLVDNVPQLCKNLNKDFFNTDNPLRKTGFFYFENLSIRGSVTKETIRMKAMKPKLFIEVDD
ncbi:hypothetical protein SGHV085 [Glossina pallidipes salivary gland hypertrophy virus]|uniref:Uncharacterized protein n=1 Tax=Glossina hytrovirus (isolate Glossina pallidipes/Ethiopia/Seibersdorf/-) TaxID=379529 RepID=B0YLN9_GHVS|nr:hypothetical protein SGHV085 [Glossina pallidipes salivary gland hypertrophy virus]ABQ08858.1 hypothetical protein SGHV085 [Glossina pallidipes salivary gland hypertrophy virus]